MSSSWPPPPGDNGPDLRTPLDGNADKVGAVQRQAITVTSFGPDLRTPLDGNADKVGAVQRQAITVREHACIASPERRWPDGMPAKWTSDRDGGNP